MSNSRTGVGMNESTSLSSLLMASAPISGLLPSKAHNADPENEHYKFCIQKTELHISIVIREKYNRYLKKSIVL